MGEGELDSEMFYPAVYQTELKQGDAVDFCVSGLIMMVHLFTANPPDSSRSAAITYIG